MGTSRSSPFRVQIVAPGSGAGLVTPQKDADGRVTQAWLDGLDNRTQYEIAGTRLSDLRASMVPSDWVKWNVEDWDAFVADYSGCAPFMEEERLFLFGGGIFIGHGTNYNGVIEFDVRRMRHRLLIPPTNNAETRLTFPGGVPMNYDVNYVNILRIMHDGKMAATHVYGGACVMRDVRKVRWARDYTIGYHSIDQAPEWTNYQQQDYDYNGGNRIPYNLEPAWSNLPAAVRKKITFVGPDWTFKHYHSQIAEWDEVNKRVFWMGNGNDSDGYQNLFSHCWFKSDGTRVLVPHLKYSALDSQPVGNTSLEGHGCKVGRRYFYFKNSSGMTQRGFIVNFDTDAVEEMFIQGDTRGPSIDAEGNPSVYVPTLNAILRFNGRLDGVWLVDLSSETLAGNPARHTFQQSAFPIAGMGAKRYGVATYNRVQWWPRAKAIVVHGHANEYVRLIPIRS